MHRLAVAAFLLVVAATKSSAADVADLYQAETIVTGTVEPERSRGFRIGLTNVMIKLTGDARLANDGRLRPLLGDPRRFIAGFEYEDRMKGIPIHDEQGTRDRPHFLRMQFKQAEIDAALKRLGLREWPADRPLLAVWLGVRAANGSYVLQASGASGYGQRAVLQETAKRRGIPIHLPAAKGAQPAVAFEDIAAGNLPKIAKASAGADALLVGVLEITDGGYWNISWRLVRGTRSRAWTRRRVSFDTALKDGLQTSALVLSGNAPF